MLLTARVFQPCGALGRPLPSLISARGFGTKKESAVFQGNSGALPFLLLNDSKRLGSGFNSKFLFMISREISDYIDTIKGLQ